jgi:hypothetical protein
MKILITESQYKLIKEQNENPSLQIIEKEVVYTSKKKYNLAKTYYDVIKIILTWYQEQIEVIKQKSSVSKQFVQNWSNLMRDVQNKTLNIIRNSKLPINFFNKKIDNLLPENKYFFVTFYGNKKVYSDESPRLNDIKTKNLMLKYGIGNTFSLLKGTFTIEKPIFKDTSIKPLPKGTTTQQVVNKQTTDTILRPNPVTKFSVSWREDLPSGEVNQNTHYFFNYDEWKEFVNQHPNTVSQNENGSKTEAQALYSGLHADISKDKTVKGPQ